MICALSIKKYYYPEILPEYNDSYQKFRIEFLFTNTGFFAIFIEIINFFEFLTQVL